MPKRIQRRRTKGWKAPEGTVNCTRPGKFGNPFKVGDYVMKGDAFGARGAFSLAYTITSKEHADSRYALIETTKEAVGWYRWYMETYHREEINELRGKDLMCFCQLCEHHKDGRDGWLQCLACAPCHVDVLLEIANK
jgi:hypothetical protein